MSNVSPLRRGRMVLKVPASKIAGLGYRQEELQDALRLAYRPFIRVGELADRKMLDAAAGHRGLGWLTSVATGRGLIEPADGVFKGQWMLTERGVAFINAQAGESLPAAA